MENDLIEKSARRKLSGRLEVASLLLVGCLAVLVAALLGVTVKKDWTNSTYTELSVNDSDVNPGCIGYESVQLMNTWCTKPEYMTSCFDLVHGVEKIMTLENKTVIYDYLDTLEPQNGTVVFWAVDESNEDYDSHLNEGTIWIADHFNNSAYFYSARMHRKSVDCGGWSLGFWRDTNGKRSVQLAYCNREGAHIRVCGSVNIQKEA
eukprot:TRINITY_DN2864_c0_g1_i1.p1 TRINITY_DN2864_c0_g1~~TRINITY_DN2864_c0_g1_i1.p1  ORF type:complete len:206 (+),score=45.53 TRINITY_DN2864_c0_g1_i1:88-705(+)